MDCLVALQGRTLLNGHRNVLVWFKLWKPLLNDFIRFNRIRDLLCFLLVRQTVGGGIQIWSLSSYRSEKRKSRYLDSENLQHIFHSKSLKASVRHILILDIHRKQELMERERFHKTDIVKWSMVAVWGIASHHSDPKNPSFGPSITILFARIYIISVCSNEHRFEAVVCPSYSSRFDVEGRFAFVWIDLNSLSFMAWRRSVGLTMLAQVLMALGNLTDILFSHSEIIFWDLR